MGPPNDWDDDDEDGYITVDMATVRAALTLSFIGGLVFGLIIGLAN